MSNFQIYYALFSSLLSLVMTKTSINGLLNRGSMHLFSLNQLREFLDFPVDWISRDKRVVFSVKIHRFIKF